MIANKAYHFRSLLLNSKDKKSQFEGAKAYCTCVTKFFPLYYLGLIRNSVSNFSWDTIIASCWMLLSQLSRLFTLKGTLSRDTFYSIFSPVISFSRGDILISPAKVAHVRGKFVSGWESVWEVLARGMYRSPTFRKAAGSPPFTSPCSRPRYWRCRQHALNKSLHELDHTELSEIRRGGGYPIF